ncbi:peptide MFS transporter [Steroidobacter sp. S1-65]|uniref:Peptide MFS transporter n=1 Tax=Steroidobacter gossypii TaxID=2805490 RepID=A0ABS1X1V4_9GAMM|nr:peptide MFS transporter [Steroidobacter gossypii]MBM0107181.1 peptide MFS transporter [Steroidobacter gossypii]
MNIIAEANQGIASPVSSAEFLGHPRGLAYIAFTEAWERFSFYGMQALLVLYMSGYLLQPGVVEQVAGFAGLRAAVEAVFGTLSTQALAGQIFGLYIGLVYFMPIFGGLLGDRLLGRKRAVLIGAAAMAVGHFLMAFEASFLPALAALIIGSGLLKGNLAAQVGALYSKDDRRRDSAYTTYCTAINVGAFIAPLVCGTLGEFYGWHYGFGAAGIGMLIGIVIYLSGARYLPDDRPSTAVGERPKLQPGDLRKVIVILVLLSITALFWTVQTQVWNTYPVWLRDEVDRSLPFGLMLPVTWFQALDSLSVLLFAPLVMLLWRRQAQRGAEPSDLGKIALGCGFFAVACLLLSAGQALSGERAVPVYWPIAFHFICAASYLYVAPIALALVSRAAPAAVNAMMVGSYYLGLFVGGIASGWLARFYEPAGPAFFWLIHMAIALAGALSVLALRKMFIRVLDLKEQQEA